MHFNMVSATYSHKPRFELLPCPYLLGAGKTHTYVLPFRMNSPKEGRYEYLRLLTLVSSRLLDNRRRAGDLADRSGIEPDSHGLTVRPHTFVRFGQNMVGDDGNAPRGNFRSQQCRRFYRPLTGASPIINYMIPIQINQQ